MEQTKWIERKFSFSLPTGWLPNVIERLRGTSTRLREMTGTLTEAETGLRKNSKWSIKDHIGHLSDLEELHTLRLDEFIGRSKKLSAADMGNTKTYSSDHASKSLQKLLNDFSIKRRHFIHRLLLLDEDTLEFKSKHPRLNKLLSPVDLAYFVAEHDDHHLAIIRQLMDATKK